MVSLSALPSSRWIVRSLQLHTCRDSCLSSVIDVSLWRTFLGDFRRGGLLDICPRQFKCLCLKGKKLIPFAEFVLSREFKELSVAGHVDGVELHFQSSTQYPSFLSLHEGTYNGRK